MKTKKKIVICLEGAHGAGKTYLLDVIKKKRSDIAIVKEHYLEMNKHGMKDSHVMVGYMWMLDWYVNVKMALEDKDIIVTDRSAFSSMIYRPKYCDKLENMYEAMMRDLEKYATIYHILIDVRFDLNLERLQMRFNIDKRMMIELCPVHLYKTKCYYRKLLDMFDAVIRNGEDSREVKKDVMRTIRYLCKEMPMPCYLSELNLCKKYVAPIIYGAYGHIAHWVPEEYINLKLEQINKRDNSEDTTDVVSEDSAGDIDMELN